MGTKDKSIRIALVRKVYSDYYSNPLRSLGYQPTTLSRTTTGSNNPNFRKQIERHQNATTAFTGTLEFIDSRPATIWITWNTIPGQVGHPRKCREEIVGDIAAYGQSFNNASAGSLSEATAKAYQRFNKACQAQNRLISGGVVIGELRETLKMLRAPAKALIGKFGEYLGAVNKRSRGVRKKSKSMKKVIADTWLEYSFGWVPFLNDIEDAQKLYGAVGRKETYQSVTAGGTSSKIVDPGGWGTNTFGDDLKTLDTGYSYEESHVRIKGEVRVKAITNTQSVVHAAGLTFDQFVPTLWELLPWSFLADYFTNIGDILAYDNKVYSDLAWHFVGKKTDKVKIYTSAPHNLLMKNKIGYIASGGETSYAKLTRRTISRSIDTNLAFYFPSLQLSLPDRDSQKLNIAALLASASATHPQLIRR